jgi:hypothetical protein
MFLRKLVRTSLFLFIVALGVAGPSNTFAGVQVGDPYDQREAEGRSGQIIEKRDISEDIHVYIHEASSYVVWTRGPKKEHIYRIVSKEPGAVFNPPSGEALRNRFISAIDYFKDLTTHEQKKEEGEFSKEISDIFESKYGSYFFRDAQYFHFSKEINEAILLYLQLQKLRPWNYFELLGQERLLNPIFENKLRSIREAELQLGNSNGEDSQILQAYEELYRCIRTPDKDSFDSCYPEEIILTKKDKLDFDIFFSEMKKVDEGILRPFPPSFITHGPSAFLAESGEAPLVYLSHGTFSGKLPGLIQLGGISSAMYADFQKIPKLSGGEQGGKYAADPHFVSFWGSDDGHAKIGLGFGLRSGFEYPISFGVGRANAINPDCTNGAAEYKSTLKRRKEVFRWGSTKNLDGIRQGAMLDEKVVIGFYPLICIDYVFVPPFALEEVQTTLMDHNLEHIQVIPYSIELIGKNRVPWQFLQKHVN